MHLSAVLLHNDLPVGSNCGNGRRALRDPRQNLIRCGPSVGTSHILHIFGDVSPGVGDIRSLDVVRVLVMRRESALALAAVGTEVARVELLAKVRRAEVSAHAPLLVVLLLAERALVLLSRAV